MFPDFARALAPPSGDEGTSPFQAHGLVLVEQHVNTLGRTALYHYLGACIKDKKRVLLIVTSGNVWQYAYIARKMGLNLAQASEEGIFSWYQVCSDQQLAFLTAHDRKTGQGNSTRPSIPPHPTASRPPPLPAPVSRVLIGGDYGLQAMVNELASDTNDYDTILVDNLNAYHFYIPCMEVMAWTQWLHARSYNSVLRRVVVLANCDAEGDDQWLTQLEHQCDVLLRYEPLETGLARDVDCRLHVIRRSPGQGGGSRGAIGATGLDGVVGSDGVGFEAQTRYHVKALDNDVKLQPIS